MKPSISDLYKGDESPDESPDAPDDSDTEPKDPLVQAFSLLREAIEDGDDEAGADAFKQLHKLCDSYDDDMAGSSKKPAITAAFGQKG